MSSIKPLTKFGRQTGAVPVEAKEINMIRLDTFLSNESIRGTSIYLKIDTQGYEKEVITGAGNALNKIAAIQAEIALIHTYEDESDYLEMLLWMRRQNFEVTTAVANSAVGAQVREFDFVFSRSTSK